MKLSPKNFHLLHSLSGVILEKHARIIAHHTELESHLFDCLWGSFGTEIRIQLVRVREDRKNGQRDTGKFSHLW